MKNLYILFAMLIISHNYGMQPPNPAYKNPESLQTLCLKHFLYNTKQIKDIQLKRILSRERLDPFEEYHHLFEQKVNPGIAARLQILLFYDLKPTQNFPLLSHLVCNWPSSEPLACLQSTLDLVIKKNLTNALEICKALHFILNNVIPYPRFALAEFLIETGLNNNLCEYFRQYPNSLRIWPTINYGNLTNDMQKFLLKVAQAELPTD